MLYNVVSKFNKFLRELKEAVYIYFCQNETLKDRMRFKVEHYNSGQFDKNQLYVISVKSKKLLEFLNEKTETYFSKLREFEEHNKILQRVCELAYKRFNPKMIYTFNDEFHFVFDERDTKHPLYNCNINKKLTTITSFLTHHLTKELTDQGIDLELVMSAKWVSFNFEFEALNYLIFRQNHCTNNNIRLLYEYFDSGYFNLSLEEIINRFMNVAESSSITNDIIYGNFYENNKFNCVDLKTKNKELCNCE
jgi:hypothetical protein